jgi:radical SAM protein with 4Fe4S-binding SPASM domain
LSEGKPPGASQEDMEKLADLRLAFDDSGIPQDDLLDAAADLFMSMHSYGEAYHAIRHMSPARAGKYKSFVDSATSPRNDNKQVTLEISTYCNLRCPLCVHNGEKPYPGLNQFMPFSRFQKIWNNIKPYASTVVLVGQGETFLHPQIYEILECIYPVPVIVDTNGHVPLDSSRILRSSIKTLVFSVDGIDQETYGKYRVNGSFAKVIKNIETLVAARRACGLTVPELQFKYILFKHNEMYVKLAQELRTQLGMDSFRPEPCIASSWFAPETVKEYMGCGFNANLVQRIDYIDYGAGRTVACENRRSPHCLYVYNSFSVLIDGSLLPCCATSYDNSFGNLEYESFKSIWESVPYQTFRTEVLENSYAVPSCRNCSMKKSNFGKMFNGTILEYPKLPEPTANLLRVNDLTIDESYARELLAQGRGNELNYFIASNKYRGKKAGRKQ